MAGWAAQPLLAIDTETTGIKPTVDRIVEVAAVAFDADGAVTNRWSTVVDPGIDIPDGAAEVHGITTERARAEGVQPAEALATLATGIASHGGPAVIYNAGFDWPLLLAEAARHGIDLPWPFGFVDPCVLARRSNPKISGRLTSICEAWGVPLGDDAHGALADATAAGLLARHLAEKYPRLAAMTLAELQLRQARWHEEWRVKRNRELMDAAANYRVPAGWPIPCDLRAVDMTVPVAPVLEVVSDPTPTPRPEYEPTDKQIATLASKAFADAYAAAPTGKKTGTVDRLRYALTHAITAGPTSLKDLSAKQKREVQSWLDEIVRGRLTYALDEDGQGVSFTLVGSSEAPRHVAWTAFEGQQNESEPAA